MASLRLSLHCIRTVSGELSNFSCVCLARRALKHRSLAHDDPFGERSTLDDPSDGIYSAWNGIDQDAFVNAAASEDVRTAHFGPEWSKFSTIGRLSVKKMKDQTSHILTAEEIHAREISSKRKALERNYATYDEFVAAELGVSGEDNGDDVDDLSPIEECDDNANDEIVDASDNDPVPLPAFMATQADATTSAAPPQPRQAQSVPAPLLSALFDALGEPHGSSRLPRTDPLQWTTDDIVLWIAMMEATPSSDKEGAERVMDDTSMCEAFRMAAVSGEFLLQHTVPPTMFQLMRRWHTRRQEIALAIMAAKQRECVESAEGMDRVITAAIDAGRPRLEEIAAKVTAGLIQETISQCYPYCR